MTLFRGWLGKRWLAPIVFLAAGAACFASARRIYDRPLKRGLTVEMVKSPVEGKVAVGMRLVNSGDAEIAFAKGDFDVFFTRDMGADRNFALSFVQTGPKYNPALLGSAPVGFSLKPKESRLYDAVLPAEFIPLLPAGTFGLTIFYDVPKNSVPADRFRGRVSTGLEMFKK